MNNPTTAGIIATFNQDRYIVEAIESLAGQVDQIIVVNDCSNDDTRAVLDSLRLGNLTVLHNDQQRGVSGSYNRAVAQASAEILLIQGGDDRSLPGRAAAQKGYFADPTVSLVYSLPRVINARGGRLPDNLAAEFSIGHEALDPLAFLFFESNFICAPAAALRRSDYLRWGGFRAGLDLLQDYALWLDLAATGSFVCLPRSVVEYRKHGTNLSREYVGVDAPKQRRLAAEREVIRNRFVAETTAEARARLALDRGLDLGHFRVLSAPEQVALLQLAHPDKLVLRRGLAYLMNAAGAPDGEVQLDRLGLSLRDIARFATAADHENLDDMGRALAVAHSLTQANSNRKDI